MLSEATSYLWWRASSDRRRSPAASGRRRWCRRKCPAPVSDLTNKHLVSTERVQQSRSRQVHWWHEERRFPTTVNVSKATVTRENFFFKLHQLSILLDHVNYVKDKAGKAGIIGSEHVVGMRTGVRILWCKCAIAVRPGCCTNPLPMLRVATGRPH